MYWTNILSIYYRINYCILFCSNPTQSTNASDRHSRQMYHTMARFGQQMPPPPPPPQNHNGFYIKRRMGEVAPPPPPQTPSASPPAAVRNDRQQPPNTFRPLRPLPPALNFEQIRQASADISETDLYLLSAIEKLVHRVDYLEKRLQTTDKLILHLLNDVRKEQQQRPTTTAAWPTTTTATSTTPLTSTSTAQTVSTVSSSSTSQSATTSLVQSIPSVISTSTTTTELPTTSTTTLTTATTSLSSKPSSNPTKPSSKPTRPATKPEAICPHQFTAIRSVCYHFNNAETADWKTANANCRRLGAQLAEFGTAREFKLVSEHLLGANNGTRFTSGGGFWLGGLNPGLLWIWSSSAKPVNSATNLAAFGSQSNKTSTTVIPPNKPAVGSSESNPLSNKEKKVFDIQGNGRCLNLQFNRTLRSFEYFGEDCSRPLGFVCEQRNRQVENEIARVFRALRLE